MAVLEPRTAVVVRKMVVLGREPRWRFGKRSFWGVNPGSRVENGHFGARTAVVARKTTVLGVGTRVRGWKTVVLEVGKR